ncbi:MAG: PD40 domain-containing protein [Kiritimatiellae bacterium]|nr:PD40 domain-containing protein [Kiritimatiellia bacterium]
MNSSINSILRRALPAILLTACLHAGAVNIVITPDYFNIEMPPNIAPLNFDVAGAEGAVTVTLRGEDGATLSAEGPNVRFPLRAWRRFLAAHTGQPLVGTLTAGADSYIFTNTVSRFPIATHLTYRLIPPGYTGFNEVGIYQRDLTSFDERPLYRNIQGSSMQCVNCHTYNAGDPKHYLFHTRAQNAGTMVVSEKYGKMKIQPKLPNGYAFGVYPAWHPSGDHIAFSCNDTSQIFHVFNPDKIEVMDSRSDLFLYSLKDGKVTMIEQDPTLFECYPTWSPDGTLLITSSARTPFTAIPDDRTEREQQVQRKYSEVCYDLAIRTFDAKSLTFSPRHILVDALASKRSCTFPRVSPDGRWLVFTVSPYGVFSIWHRAADLWILDLQKKTLRPLNEINSPAAESYHCFSRNGRWMVFSSRRNDGLYTRPYFAAFNPETGTFSKPFMLPAENPADHRNRLLSYNIPELSDGPVRETPRDLRRLVESPPRP